MTRDDDRLQRYFDGELDAEGLAEVERELEAPGDARAYLRELQAVQEAVRSIASARAAAAPDLADSILARALAEPGPLRRRAERGRLLRLAPPAGLLLAAAAALLLYLRPGPKPSEGLVAGEPSSVVTTVGEQPSAEPAVEVAEQEASPGASIESVDFGDRDGSIFMVATGPEATPVVWLVDDADEARDRIAPL
jgi:anti-sigma factor RsiW